MMHYVLLHVIIELLSIATKGEEMLWNAHNISLLVNGPSYPMALAIQVCVIHNIGFVSCIFRTSFIVVL